MTIRRLSAILGLFALGFTLASCTKCGWIWQDAQSCHSDRFHQGVYS